MKLLDLGEDPTILVRTDKGDYEASIYSEQGKELIDLIALKQSVYYKTMYDFQWLGVRIIQFPADMIALQQILLEVRPTLVIETGVAHGGCLVYSASLLDMLGISNGRVLGIDIDIREDNRTVIESHRYSPMIKLCQASSTSSEAIEFVKLHATEDDTVLVILDSDHSQDHVSEELELYSHFVSSGSFIIAMDGALGYVGDVPGQTPEAFNNNPLSAIQDFLKTHSEFKVESIFDDLGVTSSPSGALRKA
ncbi:cephalosporin hydroxylase family protein [Luminiphilus sp.]|nr:cephalosporin hydroxylase family protein [Luminiphilus sp.]